MKKDYTSIILTIAFGFIAYKILGVISKVIGGVSSAVDFVTGKGDSETEQSNAVNQSSSIPIKWFNPNYGFNMVREKYKDVNKYYLNIAKFNSNRADQLSKNIYDAKNFLNDNELAVYNAFIQIPSLACLSLVAHRFIMLYPAKGGLINYLSTFLSAKEQDTVLKILNKKPIF